MNQLLESLEIPLKVVILPERKDKDAEINLEESIIFIYSQDEEKPGARFVEKEDSEEK